MAHPPPGSTKQFQDARRRYRTILQRVCVHSEFTTERIATECPDVTIQAIREVLRRLRDDGWLVERESNHVDLSPMKEADTPPPENCEPRGESRKRTATLSRSLAWRQDRSEFPLDRWIENQVCGTQVTASPVQERPRERLRELGAEALTTAELLAILIRTGRKGESAVQAGQRLANRFANQLEKLHEQSLLELKSISTAVSEPAYCQIMAGIELGRRVAKTIQASGENRIRITSADLAIEYCRCLFDRLAMDARQEEFHIVTLDTKYQPITNHRITVGTLDASLVHPREVFRPAIRDAAAAVLLIHNHPSGDPTPSNEDIKVTRQLESAGTMLGILVIDHIIVAAERALSIKQWQSKA